MRCRVFTFDELVEGFRPDVWSQFIEEFNLYHAGHERIADSKKKQNYENYERLLLNSFTLYQSKMGTDYWKAVWVYHDKYVLPLIAQGEVIKHPSIKPVKFDFIEQTKQI